MAYQNLENLFENRIFNNFNELNKQYRDTGHEEIVSAYLYQWGKNHGLESYQDQYLNVIIKKPATFGYENAPAVILQAHMDMVCDLEENSTHDFLTDPILMKLDGDMLSSAVGTSLGADNGIGVAMIMTILEANDIPHPAIEALFTATEETTMNGAVMISPKYFSAKYLINLDHGVDDEVLAGGCGGIAVRAGMPITRISNSNDLQAFTIDISGMKGGHSGEDIAKGRGNANILLGRVLLAIKQQISYYLADILGGTQRQTIAWRGKATICVKPEQVEQLKKIVDEQAAIFHEEFEVGAPDLSVKLIEVENSYADLLSDESLEKFLQMLILSPNGIQEMNAAVSGVVESSTNIGVITLYTDKIEIIHELRGGFASTKYYIYEKIKMLMELLGGTAEGFHDYPHWQYIPNSALRDLAADVFEREFNKPLKTIVVHAGIEVGAIRANMPYLDAISIGPNCFDIHSPRERVSVASTEMTYSFLLSILKNIKN